MTNPAQTSAQLMRAGSKRGSMLQRFAEAQVDVEKREIRCILVTEGPGNTRDKNFYTEEAIRSGVKLFEGARAFMNHQTEAEQDSRPEQDVWGLVGYYKDVKMVNVEDKQNGKMVAALEATLCCDGSETGEAGFTKAVAALRYQEMYTESAEVYCGLSINAGGVVQGTVEVDGEDWNKIVAFDNVRSVDVVTRPARGGAFVRLLESVAEAMQLRREPMKKTAKKIMAELTEAEKLVKAESDATKRATLEAKAAGLREELKKAVEALPPEKPEDKDGDDEPEPKDDEEESEDEGEEEAGDISKLIPKGEAESDEEYSERLKAAKKALMASGDEEEAEDEDEAEGDKKAGKATESEVSKFKKENPKLYNSLMVKARETFGEERKDFKAVRDENRQLKAEIQLATELRECEKLLKGSGIPSRFLKPSDLVRLDEAARKREINRWKLVMESAGSDRVFSGAREAEGGPAIPNPAEFDLPAPEKE